MRGNEFEKRVQEEMEELHLRPSATVWEEVENELRKKKRRRVVFYLSMLAGLGLLGYAGFTYFSQENTRLASQDKLQQLQTDKSSNSSTAHPINNSSAGQQPSTSSANDNNATTTIQSSLPDNTGNTSVSNSEEKLNKPARQQPNQPVSRHVNPPAKQTAPVQTNRSSGQPDNQAHYQSATPSRRNSNGQLVANQKTPAVRKQTPVAATQQQTPVDDQPVTDKVNSVSGNTDIATNTPPTDVSTPAADVKKDSAIAKVDLKTELPSTEKQDHAIAATRKPSKLKFRIGFDGSIGKNYSRNNSFKVPSKSYMQESFSPVLSGYYTNASNNSPTPPQSAANGGFAGNLGAGFVRPPSPITAELAFKAGVSAEIQISKRSSIVAGIRYAYLSESLEVGQHGFINNLVVNRWQGPFDALQNSSVNVGNGANPLVSPSQYYTGGYYYGPNSKNYTNRYHFLELPLSYQWQVTDGKRIQVLWNAGVTTSVLLGTNALVYDTAAFGIYYKNNTAFNPVHFSFHSGLSFRFGKENKLQWSIGPEFSMDMTHVLKNDFILRNRYFMYGGITARVLLPERNKK